MEETYTIRDSTKSVSRGPARGCWIGGLPTPVIHVNAKTSADDYYRRTGNQLALPTSAL